MKMKMAVVATLLSGALMGPGPARSAHAQSSSDRWQPSDVRLSEVVALQDDLNRLDSSLARLEERLPFDPEVDQIRAEVIALRNDVNDGRGSREQLDDLHGRIASLQEAVDRVQPSRDTPYGYGQLPAGAEVRLRLERMVSSRSARPDERVEATVVAPVVWNGRTVIPAGTAVSGYVADVDSRERGQRDGRLRLEFNRLLLGDGTSLDFRSHVVSVEERHVGRGTGKIAGIGALLGGVIGGIFHGGKGALIGAAVGAGGALLATPGQDVELPAGSQLVLRVDEASPVARR